MKGITLYYDCPECAEETSAFVSQSEYSGSDQLGKDLEDQKEKICPDCQKAYDKGGLTNKDFIKC